MYKFCPKCGIEINKATNRSFVCKCGFSFYANPKPTSSFIPIYKNEILLYERAFEPSIGKLDLIGGFLEYREDPIIGGIREFNEETGIKLKAKDLEFLGIFMGKYPFKREVYSTLNIIYTVNFKAKIIPKGSDEIGKFLWIPVNKTEDFAFAPIKEAISMINKKLKL